MLIQFLPNPISEHVNNMRQLFYGYLHEGLSKLIPNVNLGTLAKKYT